MEDINSYNERVFIAPKSNKTDVVKQIVDEMDVDNEDAVLLGNKSVYLNTRDFYANNALDGDDWDKYSDGLLKKEFANLNHTMLIMPGLMKRSSRELIAEMDLLKINLKYVHQVKTRIKRTITIPLIPIQTLITAMMILIKRILQMIHLVTCRKSHHHQKKALNQWMRKMKSRMISNHLQNPLTMKNLLPDILEEAVFTLLMKNLRKVVTTAVNLTKDHRAILMIHLKNLNLVHQDHIDQLGFPNPYSNMEVLMAINPQFRLKKKLDLKEHGKELLNQKLKP
jgi:hypothetical protein